MSAFAITAASGAAAFWLLVVWLDPYGLRTGPGRPPTPIMDLNQRYFDHHKTLAASDLTDLPSRSLALHARGRQ